MPQPKQLSWTKLRVGLLVVVSLTIFVIGVFLISGEGFLQAKITLRTYMDNAGGLREGDPVRVSGINAGNVEEIRLSARDAQRPVEVVMKVQRRYQDDVRTDSLATLQAEGLLGQRFINITRGTPPNPLVPDGGVVPLRDSPEISEVVETSADVMVKLNRITGRVDNIMAQVEAGKGTIGRLIYDESLYAKANRAVDEAQKLISDTASGRGSLGKFLTDEQFYDNLNATVQKADAIVDDVRKAEGSLGKFIYDPDLYQKAENLMVQANQLVDNVQRGQGTLGKMITDDSLFRQTSAAADSFAKIGAQIEKGQGTAGRLIHDPALYANTNQMMLSVRELIADFRQNPKKFLTIKLEIF